MGSASLAAALGKRSEEHKAEVRTPGRPFLSISVCLAGKTIGNAAGNENLEGERKWTSMSSAGRVMCGAAHKMPPQSSAGKADGRHRSTGLFRTRRRRANLRRRPRI